MSEHKPDLSCAYGGHSWVRDTAARSHLGGVYFKRCIGSCGGQYQCSELEWFALPEPSAGPDVRGVGARESGWTSFEKQTRQQAIATCYALEDMRDRAIVRAERAEATLRRVYAVAHNWTARDGDLGSLARAVMQHSGVQS